MTVLGECWERDTYRQQGQDAYRHTQYLRPIAYADAGTWQRINSNWQDGDPEYPNVVEAARLAVRVTPEGARRLFPTREAGVYVHFGRPLINGGSGWEPVDFDFDGRSGNLLLWKRAQAWMYLWHSGHFCKTGLWLRDGYTPPNDQFAFRVDVAGLTRQGGTFYRDGAAVMRLQAPIVFDYDNPGDVRPCEWEIVPYQGNQYAVITLPDLSGMSKPFVDPQLVLQPGAAAGEDTYLQSTSADTNYGTSATAYVGLVGVAKYRELIRFDLTTLPAAAVISSTVFSLWVNTDLYSYGSGTNYRIFRQKRAWVEAQATWNIYATGSNWQTAGGFGANDCEQTAISTRAVTPTETVGAFMDFTVTATAKNDLDYGLEAGGAATGWLVKADNETNSATAYAFDSSDGLTAAQRPKLTIDYIIPGDSMHGLLNYGLMHAAH